MTQSQRRSHAWTVLKMYVHPEYAKEIWFIQIVKAVKENLGLPSNHAVVRTIQAFRKEHEAILNPKA